jgi:hypothetical protein
MSMGKMRGQYDIPLGVKHHVSRQFSDWHHVGRLLQLDCLLVNEAASVVENDIRVHRAVF